MWHVKVSLDSSYNDRQTKEQFEDTKEENTDKNVS